MNFGDWLYNIMTKGLGAVTHRYYAIYRGIVEDNKDPEKRGRIKVRVKTVGQSQAPDYWAMPALPGSGKNRGMFFAPEVGDTVWVSFYEGDPNKPDVYFGGWFGNDMPAILNPTDFPERKGFVTRAGHALVFNDEAGKESITILWNKPADGDAALTDRTQTAKQNPAKNTLISVDKNGSYFLKTVSSYLFQIDEDKKQVTITSPKGSMFHIADDDSINLVHKSGASVALSDDSVNVSGTSSQAVNISGKNISLNGGGVNLGAQAADMAVLGLKLVAWLAFHVHPTALGPSLPPMVPPTPADFCSTSVKVQM